ncbi:MAG: HDIG domain-containing protein [Firmicutes bacterium]|jgi:putative nucleotidyltransferase with HDIG domain|nr:HDIG domain-containing protein [Bacillota bacterium]
MSRWEKHKGIVKEKLKAGLLDNLVVRQWLLGVVIFAALFAILVADFVPQAVRLAPGQVAQEDMQAPKTIVNSYRTKRLQEEAAKAALEEAAQNPANYEIDPELALQAQQDIAKVFEMVELFRQEFLPLAYYEEGDEGDGLDKAVRLLQDELRRSRGLALGQDDLRRLLIADGAELIEVRRRALELSGELLLQQRINEDNLDEVKAKGAALAAAEGPLRVELQEALASLVEGVLRPNLKLSEEKLAIIREEAVAQVEPVLILKDQIIVRKGEVVSPEQVQILSDLGLLKRGPNYPLVLGMGFIVLLLLGMLGVYIHHYLPDIFREERFVALLGLVLVFVAFMAKIFSLIPWVGVGYLIPVAFGGMMIALLVDSRLALMVTVALAVLTGVMNGNDFGLMFVALTGGVAAVLSVSKVSQRADLMRAGFAAGAAIFASMVAVGAIRSDALIVKYSFLGLGNGLFSAVLTIGFLPYLESIFSITSSIRLLELSNPNQPLLRRLLVEAPGTYHHSIIVGNLAEAAAEAVGGDALLARVGSYYHDIGKLKRPYFFTENQFTEENPHEKIAPTLSTLIITAHVKEGVELAREAKLPEVIVDLIRQHHGTDLVRFFFHRAAENDKEEQVEEKDFRYPGPRPQTKEAAIIMLADSVEAAVRSLAKPTPARVEQLVRRIIKERLNDGQLDESDLTFKDLDKVADAFVRVLSGIFHTRVEYPDKILSELQGKRA